MQLKISDVTVEKISWTIAASNAQKLWEYGLSGKGVRIAVIDNGVNVNHPDFSDQHWYRASPADKIGFNFSDGSFDLSGTGSHGCQVISQIIGNGHAGVVIGAAPGAQTIPLVVNNSGEQIIEAISYAIDLHIDIINLSQSIKLSDSSLEDIWHSVCVEALNKNIVICSSTGNQGGLNHYRPPNSVGYPARLPGILSSEYATGILSVGVLGENGAVHSRSGHGPTVFQRNGSTVELVKPDICSPGSGSVACNSKYPDHSSEPYCDFLGTSAATAHTSGCLALLVQACKESRQTVSPFRLASAITASARPVSEQSIIPEQRFGYGQMDIFAAWKYGRKRAWW